jgi:ABC-type transport system involved in cytochrome bd biosynthesis fused ATPase/permease subunit
VYYKPYESRGQAWPTSFVRMCWGLIIFQLFMTGLFSLNQAFVLSTLMTPLILFTVYYSYRIHRSFEPLAHFVNLSQANEVQKGSSSHLDGMTALGKSQRVTRSQTNLNRARYGHEDNSLCVVNKVGALSALFCSCWPILLM